MTTSPRQQKPACKRCGSDRTSRMPRKGFFQEKLMFKLGYFPWECNSCWKRFWSRQRGKRVRRNEMRQEHSA